MATDKQHGSILIVDDTPTNLEILVTYLSDFGFDVSVAKDGESALDRLKYTSPDIHYRTDFE